MALYARMFVLEDVAKIHRDFVKARALANEADVLAARLGRPAVASATKVELGRAYAQFERELEQIARRAAVKADASIRFKLKKTQKRPDTGVGPHLRSRIHSRALPKVLGFATGAVGVANVAKLDEAIDPDYPQFGTYWTAQEFGTTAHVGREIKGFFFGPGYSNPMRPTSPPPDPLQPLFMPSGRQRSAYADLGFSGGAGKRGGVGGRGTIRNPIHPRFFIRDGANLAEAEWRSALRALEQQTVKNLRRALRP